MVIVQFSKDTDLFMLVALYFKDGHEMASDSAERILHSYCSGLLGVSRALLGR